MAFTIPSIKSLDTVTTGTGAILDNGIPRSNHSMNVVGAGTIVAGVVTLQGSLNGVDFIAIGSPVTALGGGALAGTSVSGVSIQFLRAVVTTPVTGGGTVSVWISSAS